MGDETGLALLRLGSLVAAIRLQFPGAGVVAQIDMQALFQNLCLEYRIIHRETGFHAVKQIAIHPVSTGAVHQVVATMVEMVDAGVLQKAADNGAYADVFRQSGDAGFQATNTAHDQINLYPRLAGPIQGLHDVFFSQ